MNSVPHFLQVTDSGFSVNLPQPSKPDQSR
jgi:hypothetical protein